MSTNIVKNDPSRFLGEGMPFRAKLIGVLQVPEARGDRMCQEALADLKMAIRAAGEHKQRITVHVAIDGLRLRDDKTGDSLYHHPVHKISFIAQDMQDSRAFGYIFGSPDSGHRFFGIKTDKAASNVVMSMRDLFQVVFELKKREIELAKQQLEAKSVISMQRQIANITSDIKSKSPLSLGETSTSASKVQESSADGGVAELVDLEQELSSLRRGLTQVEGLTPPGDPFGDSFTAPTSQKGLLPPPPSGSSTRGRSTPSTSSQQSRAIFSPNKTTTATLPFDLPSAPVADFEPVPASVVDENLDPISVVNRESAATSLSYDVFTELDPLGTGKNKPYVDKKLFFQELKNPPKKVLKDLVPTTNTTLIPEALPSTEIEAKIDQVSVPTTMTSMSRHSGGSVTVVKQPQSTYSSSYFATDPFAETDPFDSADPFSDSFKDDPFTNLQDFPKSSLKSEPNQSLTKTSAQDDFPIFQEITKSNAVDVIQSYMKRSINQSSKTEKGSFQDYSKSSSAIRYDDLISSKLRESSIDFKGGEERSLDGRRGGEKYLDGRRGEERSANESRVKEITLEDLRKGSKEKWLDGRRGEERSLDGRLVFNGPLQVTLPPEPTPKSPRLKRQKADASSIRQRPQPSSKVSVSEGASPPPPPLPPKKGGELTTSRPPPPPHPHDADTAEGPPLPPPSRKKEPMADRSIKPCISAVANSSEDEYLSPAPPPLPTGRRFDITLTHLLTCSVQDLSERLQVPVSTLSSMTLPQLTTYLRSYLAADTDRTHIHVDPTIPVAQPIKHYEEPPIVASPPTSTSGFSTKTLPLPSKPKLQTKSDHFEDDFAPSTETNGTFVANFDDFDKKANSSYDRYAAFREIQEQELKTTILNSYDETKQNGNHKEDSDKDESLTEVTKGDVERLENRSPLKSLDELTIDSFNMFRKTASPKPLQIDSKIEDVKNVMKNLQIEQSRRSVSPRETVTFSDLKREDRNDRYAALREITVTEPQEEFESIPSENQPKERKRSDEKSDGFDNSDFFDCIDNSSLSYSHIDDAFRKSPSVKEKEVKMVVTPHKEPEVRLVQPQPPPRLSTGSFSDMASASSPEMKVSARSEWSMSVSASRGRRGRRGSPLSSDSSHSTRRRTTRKPTRRQTSSSSRDVSPWDDEPPPRPHRTHMHHSRHNSSAGSRECIDSANSRDKDKLRDKRERDRDSRGSRDSSARERDRRSSSKERDHRRDRKRSERDRNRGADKWDRDRNRDYSREKETKNTREYRSRERGKEHRDKERERDRHRGSQRSWDDEDDYSDGCGSGRSSPRERWSEHTRWRRDDHNYGSLGYRDSRRRNESRQSEEGSDRRYGSTLSWGSGRRSGSSRRDSDRRRSKRDDSSRHRSHETRFSNDYSPRGRKSSSPFENESVDETPAPPVVNKKRQPYSSLEGTRFAFEEDTTASPHSASSGRAPPPQGGGSPASRFRFDSDSVSPKSMFEDDFCLPAPTTPRIRTASIAEEEENDLPPLRTKPFKETKEQVLPTHKDIKKSESVNIFVRENDPFENDDFFACTGSDKAARRENWPGDFQAFENV